MDGFDLIGDIHGHAEPLRALLARLGYQPRGKYGYFHPQRQVIFLGDFIDRGLAQREVINIARSMVEAGNARAVMGNHEFNALAYHTPDPQHPGEFLRRHTKKNTEQHQAFLDDFAPGSAELNETLDWFRTLPLWLDLGDIRIVHATWDADAMALIQQLLPQLLVTDDFLVQASRDGSQAYNAVENLLKGVEAKLPDGLSYKDSGGHIRHHARLKWWLHPEQKSWQTMALLPDRQLLEQLPDTPLPETIQTDYDASEPPVFFGHYWFSGKPKPQAPNVACLDYSVARPGGKLVAYRWGGESSLAKSNFVWVD